MLITESQMNIGRGFDAMDLLDKMSYLTEAESVYAPAMVPVVESNDYQAHLIKLEDMMSFSEANGIEDLGYALTLVCEASEIDPSTVAFTVQEDSIIADPEVASLAQAIMNEGVRIAAVPVSPNHPAAQLADLAVGSMLESGDSYLFDYIQEALPGAVVAEKELGVGKFGSPAGGKMSTAIQDQEGDSSTGSEIAKDELKKADGLMAKLKGYANKGRDFIAKYIAKLHDWAKKINEKMHNVDPKERSIWQSIQKKVTGAIAWLTARLSKIGTEQGGHRRENPSYWKKDEEKEA